MSKEMLQAALDDLERRGAAVRCRVCRCTYREPCNPPCSWADDDLCSNCYETALAIAAWLESAVQPKVDALLREAARLKAKGLTP